MLPGLHALSCSRCGAPLDPGDSVLGAVVRCKHCQQPHLWVAPDRVEAQGAPPALPGPSSGPRVVLVLALAVMAVVLVGGAVATFLLRGKPRQLSDERKIPADAPLVIGDRVEMAIQTKSSFQSCSFDVLGHEADGRVLGVPCGGTNLAPVSRELLRAEAYVAAEPGGVALHMGPAGWVRAEIIGPEPNDQLRLLPLGEGKSESVVPKAQVFTVQRSASVGLTQAPLPAAAPLEVGDLILRRDGALLEEGKLLTLGDAVSFERGSAYDGRFESFRESPKTASRLALLARVVTAGTKLEPGQVVLAPSGSAWQRLTVVVEDPHYLLRARGADGKEQRVVKQGLYLIRVPDKAPPAAPAATPQSNVAPLTRGFRKCFEQALAKNPKAEGKVQVTVLVGAKGEITQAEVTPSGDLPPSVAACMKSHALATKLPAPEGGPTKLVIPVVFKGG